ncbi:hypothetical protein HZA40_03025 [Candidatus Peregrinibacteria bacterium]|nr:hypothetical protein [Candidatus Peregrinibacteria bacterium]
MGWTDWYEGNRKEFPGYKVKINTDKDPWIHYLVAPLNEPKPDSNHIHLKARIANKGEATSEGVEYILVEDAYIVASVKVGGVDVINRRKLIEAINEHTGLNLRYT